MVRIKLFIIPWLSN